MNPSITFRHDFAEADLEAALPRLREVFSQVGMDFDACMAEGMIGFERVGQSVQSASEAVLELSRSLECAKAEGAFVCLKQTAEERRNPNAPWWRRFQNKQRRH